MSTHDNAYKNVFSHPKAVQDLLRGFVHEDWVQQLDYITLEKVSGRGCGNDQWSVFGGTGGMQCEVP